MLIICNIATHCDICGIKALGDESFDEERVPFRSPKRYCPACRARLYERVNIVIFLVFLLGIPIPFVLALGRGAPILDTRYSFWALIFLFQYLLTIPHELGHAIAARIFGFSQIRIIIGSGKPLFHFHLFGFPWLINRVPIGGLAYAKFNPATLTRAQWILFAAGGLFVNTAFLLVCGFLIHDGALFDSKPTALEALFWSNLIVIAENLVPYTAQTGFGPLATDGKILYDAFFFWNKLPLQHPEDLPSWSVWTARVLKLLIVLFLSICTLSLGLLAWFVIFTLARGTGEGSHAVLALILAGLAALLGYYTWRIYSQPVATKRKPQPTPVQAWLFYMRAKYISAAARSDIIFFEDALQKEAFEIIVSRSRDLLSKHPHDIVLLTYNGFSLSGLKEHAAAENVWDSLLHHLKPTDPIAFGSVYAQKLLDIMAQGEFERFLAACKEFLSLPIPDSQKLLHLDLLACNSLYLDARDQFELAEFCVRKALELAPGNLTLQGTLGALLVEQGQFNQAEPFLRACYDRSAAHHDQGISGFYLALIAEHRGDLEKAGSLARQSIILYSESWLTQKADGLFARIEARSPTRE